MTTSNRLREHLLNLLSELRPGEPLPTRTALAAEFDTSPTTVDNVMRELSAKGLVSGGSGKRRVATSSQAGARKSLAITCADWSVPDYNHDFYFGPLMASVMRACEENDVTPHVAWSQRDTNCENFVSRTEAQGLLVVRATYQDLPALKHLRRLKATPVGMVAGPADRGIPTVNSDNVAAARKLVTDLAAAGHKKLGFASLSTAQADHWERQQGFLEGAADSGLCIDAHHLLLDPAAVAALDSDSDSHPQTQRQDKYEESARAWLQPMGDKLPTAIIAADFLVGQAIYRALKTGRPEVADKLFLIHFDNPPQTYPLVSAIGQDIRQLGTQAVDMMAALIAGTEVAATTRVPFLPLQLRPHAGASGIPKPQW